MTILINKEKRGGAKSIIVIIKGTDVKTVTSILLKLSRRRRFHVREINLIWFPTWNRRHVYAFLPHVGLHSVFMHRILPMKLFKTWELKPVGKNLVKILYIQHAKACGKTYHAPIFKNGDSRTHRLTRNIYILYKKESLWNE